jgi:hypothetical protein
MEEWKEVPGYPGYKASNLGNIRGIQNRNIGTRVGNCPYKMVSMNIDGRHRMVLAHRLVALAFIPNPENLPQVHHMNAIKIDNRVENLMWVPQEDNMAANPAPITNTSGFKGISASKSGWVAQLMRHNILHRKHFKTIPDAEAWIIAKRQELNIPL